MFVYFSVVFWLYTALYNGITSSNIPVFYTSGGIASKPATILLLSI